MISWVWMQQPGLSWAWETDVGAAVLPPGPMESSEAAEKWSVCPVCVCVGRDARGELTTCFSPPLISHPLCLDYYFGKRPVQRRCINICSQFALWPHSYMFVLCLDASVISVSLLCNTRPFTLYTPRLVMGSKQSLYALEMAKLVLYCR